MSDHTSRNVKLCSISLRAEYLHKLFGILCTGGLSIVIYSLIELYQDSLLYVYCILWVIIQYYFIYVLLKLFQLWTLGTPSVASCVSLIYSHYVVFIVIVICLLFSNSLLPGIIRCSRLILYVSSSTPRISMSPGSPGSFYWRM